MKSAPTIDRCHGLRVADGTPSAPYEIRKNAGKNFFRRLFAGADAVGDADAVVGAAGESEGREWLQCGFNSFHPGVVADMVLRH